MLDRRRAAGTHSTSQGHYAIEEANGIKLRDVFQDFSFNSNKLGVEARKNNNLPGVRRHTRPP